MPISIDKDGIVEGTGTAWNDVFSDPQAFKDVLSDEALEYIQEFRKMVDDIEALRVAEGLPPLTKDRGGLLYIPRKVDSIDAVKILGRTDSHQSRTYDLATEGMFGYLDEKTGKFVGQVDYLASPRETLKLHLKAAYHEILDEQLTFTKVLKGIYQFNAIPNNVNAEKTMYWMQKTYNHLYNE